MTTDPRPSSSEARFCPAERHWAFLADISAALSDSLDYKTVLQQVAQLAVPHLADWCIVSTLELDGSVEWIAVTHGDPTRGEIARQLQRRYPRHIDEPSGVSRALRTGRPVLFSHDSDDLRAGRARDPEHLDMLRMLGSQSSIIVPLTAHGQVLGAISLIMAESGRRHEPEDASLAEHLAQRCAQAVENARLYRAAQQEIAARREAEQALRASEERLLALHNASRVVAAQMGDSNAVLDEVLNRAVDLLGGSSASLMVWQPDQGVFGCIRDTRLEPDQVRTRPDIRLGDPSLTAQCFLRREPVVVNDYQAWEFAMPWARRIGMRAGLAVPLVRRGEVSGVLVVGATQDNPKLFNDDDARLALLFADLAATSLAVSSEFERQLKEKLDERDSARYQTELILNSVADGIYGVDTQGKITFINPAAAHMLGFEPDELVGAESHPMMHYSRLDGSAYPHLDCPIWSTLQTGEERHVSDEVFWRKGGSSFPVEYTATPMRQGDAIVGAVVTFRDITARVQAERERAALAQAKDELVSMISHEVRAPATTMVAYAELMQCGEVLPRERPEILASMVREGRRLTTLINDFLKLQKLESGRLPVALRPTDLRPLLDQLATREANDRSHPLRTHLPDALPLVMADVDRLQQVLENLLSNARKYSPRGGEIRLEARCVDGTLEVSVTDQGLGVPQHALPHLFDKFYRVPGEDRLGIEGTGLGLAIARQIIEDHAGEIGATSPGPGRGTRFFFRLPILASEPAAETPAPPAPVAPDARAVSSLRVLMVDDDPATRGVVTRILRPLGCSLAVAGSPEEALEQLATSAFDVVISDLHMGPGLDGHALAEQVRQRWPNVRFVLATGSITAADQPPRSSAIDAVIGKPYRPADLQRMIADVAALDVSARQAA
jgi:PAS domain S-box-containing protein